jgi:hypothetical protein
MVIRRFKCGWRVEPGDTNSLIALLDRLSTSPCWIEEQGRRARLAFEKHYDMQRGVDRVAGLLGLKLKGAETAAAEPQTDTVRLCS